MNGSATVDLEKTAEAYDDLLVRAFFEDWAQMLAEASNAADGHRVLDVACGTGVLARALARRVGDPSSVSGLDLNPAMLAVASRRAPEIEWHEGSAESLPFGNETFDVVVSQFGLMFFSSPKTALREMLRVLRRDGRLVIAVFDSLENQAGYGAMADVFARIVGPRIGEALRFPFSMGDTDALKQLFEEVGVGDASVTTQTVTARFPSPREVVLGDVKGWFPFAGFYIDEHTLERVVDEAEKVLAPFRSKDGSVEFPVPGHVIMATRETEIAP